MTQKFEQFGKYLLLEKLATGGMAEVFLARSQAAGGISKFVAIKRILPQYADSPEFIDMFKDEAKIAINLNHANIVSIYDFGVQTNQFYLVMDYVEGRNLRQIVNKFKKANQRLGTDQIVYIAKEVAAGLEYAHRCLDGTTGKPLNITHRDMSPQNVMISFDGQVRIVDFGIAKAESQLETTRAGTLKGKFGYMSPEQAEGQTVDLRTDIFSLGIVLWELLAADRLFVAGNEINTLRKIRDCQIPSLRKIDPNIPAELERITMKALARDRNLRYQTAAAMQRDLNRFLNRQYPEFSPQDFASLIKNQFADEIFSIRQRLVEYSKLPTIDSASPAARTAFAKQPPAGKAGGHTDSFVTSENHPTTTKQDVTAPQTNITSPSLPFAKPPGGIDAGETRKSELNDETLVTPGSALKSYETGEKSDHLLDDRALRRELARARVQQSGALGVEDDIGPTSGSYRSRSLSRSGTRSRRAKQPLIPTQALVSGAGFLLTLSLYVYMGKYHANQMHPLISALDPYIGPFHSFVGISHENTLQSQHEPASTNPSKTPPAAGPTKAIGSETELPPNVVVPPPPPIETVKPELKSRDPEPLGPTEPRDKLLVTSTPSGAEIIVNGKASGSLTPGQVEIPSQREFTITLRRTGFIDYRRDGLMRDTLGHKLSATLQPALVGYLDIDVVPPQNAKLFVNGRPLNGESLPITGYAVPAEIPVTIRAEDPVNQLSVQQVIKVEQNRRRSIVLDLRHGNQKTNRQPSRKR